jgi:MFS family permease
MTHPAPSTSVSPGTDSKYHLTRGTLVSAAISIAVAQAALAIPAVLNGLFQLDISPTSSQLTWISDAFLVPVTIFELTFGVLGDLFGRKRLLVGGSILMAIGALVSVLSPGVGAPTDTRVFVLWIGQIIAGIGAAAIMPTTLAMVAAGTHTPKDRARSISIWAAALATGSFVSPVLGGFLAGIKFGSDVNASWRWSFIAIIVLAVISAIVAIALAKNSSAPLGRSLDWPGQITIAITLFALLYAVIQGSSSGWGSIDVIGGFAVSIVFFIAFILVERRSPAPLLRLDLFKNRAFAVAAIATVFGMFAFLGTAYTTSIRLSAIQGFTPLQTSIAFVLINGFALLLAPLVSRLTERYNPRWTMGIGFALIALGDLWLATIPASTMSIPIVIAPLAVIGVGFAFAISSLTGVAVNTVPNHLAGMASSTTSLLRDFGFTLGPAVIGSIALSQAAAAVQSKIAATPALQKALAAFNAAPAHAPAAQKPALEAAVGAVNSGPLGANAVPGSVTLPTGHTVPFNPLKGVAFHALDNAYSLGYLVCGLAALLAAILVIVALGGGSHNTQITQESLVDSE